VSARAAARKPPSHRSHMSQSAITMSTDAAADDDDAKAETAALIDDLKNQLNRAETASEEYMKQLEVLQSRLDDALKEQGKLEDQIHGKTTEIEKLQNAARESARQRKELEQMFEADKTAVIREKEQQAIHEEELHSTIQRLKETIAQRDLRPNLDNEGKLSRSCTSYPVQQSAVCLHRNSQPAFGTGHPPTSANASPHRPHSNAVPPATTRR